MQLELIHPLVALEDRALHAVDLVVQLRELRLQLLVLDVEAAALALGELLEVILRLDLLDLCVHQPLRVELLCVDRLEVLLHRDDALLGLSEVRLDHDDGLLVLAELAVQRAVRLVGELGQVVEPILEQRRLLHRCRRALLGVVAQEGADEK